MAVHEEDREDLLREATALVERVELQVDGDRFSVVAGFRRDGGASFYFGAEPVLQFNPAGDLRRAHVAGRMLKAERGKLVALTRQRAANEVQLVRQDLSAEEQAALLAEFAEFLMQLRDSFQRQAFRMVGQVPADGDVLARVERWLVGFQPPIRVAQSPRASGRG